MSASLAIGGLGLSVLWAGAVLAGVRTSCGISQHVARPRRCLLPARRGTALHTHVVHGISDGERMIDALRITVPRALCGEILMADPNAVPPPTDRPDAPPCPRCAARARWMGGAAVAAPLGSR